MVKLGHSWPALRKIRVIAPYGTDNDTDEMPYPRE